MALHISVFMRQLKPSTMVLQVLSPSSWTGEARLTIKVGDLGGVLALLIEQLECLRGTDIVSILK